MKYAPNTDLSIPYAETTDIDRTYRDREAMRALAEVRLARYDDASLSPQLELPGYWFDPPCCNGECWWGVPEGRRDACCDSEDEFDLPGQPIPCAGGWWFVCTGSWHAGVYALHPADAILLAARKVCGE